MTISIETIVALVLTVAVLTVNNFAGQVGATWVKEVTDICLAISVAFNIPEVRLTASSIFSKKTPTDSKAAPWTGVNPEQ